MTVYKAFREIDGKLYSCAAKGFARLEYAPQQTIYAPKGTALFAFWSAEQAMLAAVNMHLNTCYKYEVWSCDGEQSSLSLEKIAGCSAPWHKMLRVWSGRKLNRWNMYKVPEGTIFMDWLKPEKRLMKI